MESSSTALESILHRNIDERAIVRPSRAQDSLSPFLSSAFDLYEATILDKHMVIAEPVAFEGDIDSILKQCAALEKAIGEHPVLFLDLLPPAQRRHFVRAGQGFISKEGDIFLPMLSLLFNESRAAHYSERRSEFTPSQQAVFLFCLYCGSEIIKQEDAKKALGLSAGSVSSAFALFIKLRMMDYALGGKTGRRRDYTIADKARFYRIGIKYFGSPIRERLLVPLHLQDSKWLLSGLSALAVRSDLVAPKRPVFAVSPNEAKKLSGEDFDGDEYAWLEVLRYDPTPFADGECVDPFTMTMSLDDDDDERVSIALRTAMEGYEWYQE